MPKHRTVLCAGALALLFTAPVAAQAPGAQVEAPPGARKQETMPRPPKGAHRPGAVTTSAPKYYFKIVDVNVGKDGTPEIATAAREFFEKELQSRPEFTGDLGGASETAAVLAEIKKRGLKGFRMSLRLDRVTKDVKDPKPGARRKQMAVEVKLSVFGTTFPGEKLAFSGEGEAVVEAEVVEARLEEEGLSLVKEVMPQALKQAVDQAVAKLSMPKSAPMNESRRKRKS
jgi:hypothetical protein